MTMLVLRLWRDNFDYEYSLVINADQGAKDGGITDRLRKRSRQYEDSD